MFGDHKGLIGGSDEMKIKSGDVITVEVIKETGEIRWYINGKQEESYCTDILKSKKIRWVPLISMGIAGDQVEWLE